ncbi:hypothetical protein ECC46_03645 [Helicobacter pylori]|nr:hypothetical protein ECC46_03645 [Helicobacter pylori]
MKQPLKNALLPILGLVFKKALEFLNFFYCATGRLCYTKTFIFKNGLFIAWFCHFKTHFLTSLCGVSDLKVNSFSL